MNPHVLIILILTFQMPDLVLFISSISTFSDSHTAFVCVPKGYLVFILVVQLYQRVSCSLYFSSGLLWSLNTVLVRIILVSACHCGSFILMVCNSPLCERTFVYSPLSHS